MKRGAKWAAILALFSAMAWLGCSSEATTDGAGATAQDGGTGTGPGVGDDEEPTSSGSDGGGGELDAGPPIADANADGGGVVIDAGGDAGTMVSTDPNLKVAFIGDTATGANFQSVVNLIKQENAQLVMIQGDLTYNGATATNWFPVIDNTIDKAWPGSTATVTIPYIVSRGNHDVGWAALGTGLRDRLVKWGITPENGDPTTQNYSVVYKGLKMVMVPDSETSPTRADYVSSRLAGDNHVWKICSWHKNMRATNVGPKNDEMSWTIYENCRKQGALVAQGHSHTYSRSKTITADQQQTVDANCNDPYSVCVGPGRHIFFDASLGGVDTRPLDTTVAAKTYWAATYTGNYGALFIEFNVDGDPKKARGYFKTTGGTIIDPPASSGKTSFIIQRSP